MLVLKKKKKGGERKGKGRDGWQEERRKSGNSLWGGSARNSTHCAKPIGSVWLLEPTVDGTTQLLKVNLDLYACLPIIHAYIFYTNISNFALFCFFFWDRFSLCNFGACSGTGSCRQGWPWTFRDLLAFASQVHCHHPAMLVIFKSRKQTLLPFC